MESILGTLIAVIGTLAGAVVSTLVQSRQNRASDERASSQQVRQERLAAYSGFATAIATLRGAEIQRWIAKHDHGADSAAYAEAKAENFRARTAARSALTQVQLLIEDEELLAAGRRTLGVTIIIHEGSEVALMQEDADASRHGLDVFLSLASRKGGILRPAPMPMAG
ncbi:hypothetical protein OG900_37540 [Streptomyces sp. NBC_00433]